MRRILFATLAMAFEVTALATECPHDSVKLPTFGDQNHIECLVPSSATTGFRILRPSGKNAEMISAPFKQFLNKHFLSCVAQAVGAAENEISNVVAISWGIVGDRTHKPQSLHSIHRALDVHSISYRYRGTNHKQILSRKKHKQPFYEKFMSCWDNAISTRGGCEASSAVGNEGCILRRSSIGFDDCLDMFTGKGHSSHIHLSFPFCEDDTSPSKNFFWYK